MRIGLIGSKTLGFLSKNVEHINVNANSCEVDVTYSKINGHEIFFINRHGSDSRIPPHMINYKANMQAFSNCKVKRIIAINTVGSLKRKIKPGDIVIPHDFIDFTKKRDYTFYSNRRFHIDMNNPFCPELRNLLYKEAKEIKKDGVHNKGVYLVTEGPRLETVAEIKMFSNFSDIVGMTLIPELVLAREKGMCYASLCIVSNMAAGLQKTLKADDIIKISKQQGENISKIILSTIKSMSNKINCNCRDAIKGAEI
jgi:5'-methylthioadenosine phosphorylase